MRWEQLQSMTDDDVARQYNAAAEQSTGGLAFWRDELWRREAERQHRQAVRLSEEVNEQTKTIRRLTWALFILTFLVFVMTLANVWLIYRGTG